MYTWEFKYYQFSFDRFNKIQELIVPYITKDVNLVISSGTATGKTSIISGMFSYYLQLNKEIKVAYISPLKSLSSEKYNDWNNDEQLNKYGIAIDTSDYKSNINDLNKNRLLILTNESFDSKTRSKLHYEWLRKIECLVIDEAQILGQGGRGDRLEAGLMRFTEINSKARITFLSATMSNIDQISGWIKKLNNKQTIKISSNWRPVKLKFEMNLYSDNEDKMRKIREIIEMNFCDKTLVFVNSKKFGKELVQYLRNHSIITAFHNANLGVHSRNKIEKAFTDNFSGLQVLVSTKTLACGVNL